MSWLKRLGRAAIKTVASTIAVPVVLCVGVSILGIHVVAFYANKLRDERWHINVTSQPSPMTGLILTMSAAALPVLNLIQFIRILLLID